MQNDNDYSNCRFDIYLVGGAIFLTIIIAMSKLA